LASQTLNDASRGETARRRIAAGGGGPLRASEADKTDTVLVARSLTIESGLALKNRQIQILALEVPCTLKVVALDVFLLDDVHASFRAGWNPSTLWW
jgi:hypothetical protein